ncbi:MAG TPA: PAS-domain containing protein [Paenirhodobacter sp.]
MQLDWFQAILIMLSSAGAAVFALALSARLARQGPAGQGAQAMPMPEPAVFLFDGKRLVDTTGPGRGLLETATMAGDDWTRLLSFIGPRFPEFEAALPTLAMRRDPLVLMAAVEGRRHPVQLRAEDVNGVTRVTLVDPEAEGHGRAVDALSFLAMEDELELMRKTLDCLPALVWREADDGEVIWANRAYLAKCGAMSAEEDTFAWPLPRLFPPGRAEDGDGFHRVRINRADDKAGDMWFDRHGFTMTQGRLQIAFAADAVVKAEQSLHSFVQTLSKTFADLPIGLAVFDRQRKLQLFNPALIELTQLHAEFLIGRPSLHAFLDRLREARMVPEPKDYRSWRMQMTELEKAAAAGFHEETWNLPGGQTYRVTGRPHPDGAVAFLFEDITSEMTLTRRFRAELSLGQDALDQMEEAVAVFRVSGDLAFSNQRYDEMWGVDPATSLARITLHDSVRQWEQECAGSPVWSALRAGVTEIRVTVCRNNGWQMECHARPLAAGAMMVGFHVIESQVTLVRNDVAEMQQAPSL